MQDYFMDKISLPHIESMPYDREREVDYSKEEEDIMWHEFYVNSLEDQR